ncbi:hypothetical protein FOZ62_023243, partial [Perkinsus olseni]
LKAANRKRLDEGRQGLRPCSTQANRRLLEEAAAKGTGEEVVEGVTRDELGAQSREVNSRSFTASTQESDDSGRKIRTSESRTRSRGKTFLPWLPSTLYDNFVCRVGSRSYTPPYHKRVYGLEPATTGADDEGESAAMSSVDAASLMSGWEEVRTADGEVYYANCSTGDSAWERPTRMQADWMEHFSPEGDKYYFNEATGLSTWTRPVLSRPTRDERRSSGSDGVAVSELRQRLGAALGGEDWTDWRRIKAEDGKVYYYNVKTKATAWNLPPPVLSKAPDPPPGWKKVANGDGGEEFYYWNEATDEVTWDFPLPFYEEQDEGAVALSLIMYTFLSLVALTSAFYQVDAGSALVIAEKLLGADGGYCQRICDERPECIFSYCGDDNKCHNLGSADTNEVVPCGATATSFDSCT